MPFDSRNTGVLRKNAKVNPKFPDYRGSALVDGRPFDVSAWVVAKGTDKEHLGLAFRDPLPSHAATPPAASKPSSHTRVATPTPDLLQDDF